MNRLQFYFKSQTAHGLHSPSIYALYCELLNPYLKGEIDYSQLKEALSKRYSDCSLIEIQSKIDIAKTDQFKLFLEERNLIVNIRRSRGKDIDAACGQLANKNKLANEATA